MTRRHKSNRRRLLNDADTDADVEDEFPVVAAAARSRRQLLPGQHQDRGERQEGLFGPQPGQLPFAPISMLQ